MLRQIVTQERDGYFADGYFADGYFADGYLGAEAGAAMPSVQQMPLTSSFRNSGLAKSSGWPSEV
ncbi:MAG: hypothetical protein RIS70_2792 [Planctomycetota bacterium]